MASKVKNSKAFIVLHKGMTHNRGCTTLGRYCVGAKNEKEAEQFVRDEIGKYNKVRVYYEDKNRFMPHGMVIREC